MKTDSILWELRLNSARRKPRNGKSGRTEEETRTEIERDFDRILFSTPVRRLADKTQVFPLERNDGVRTRLTHSYEVSNLARSIGTTLVFNHEVAKTISNAERNIPALLAAIGLVHDLGNPPFGHQGEKAIRSWFDKNAWVLDQLENKLRQDFLYFEGNAQTFRLLTKLQIQNDNYGLDLAYATLASLMKYTTSSDQRTDEIASKKKHGFFASEYEIAQEVLEKVGLECGKRHPLAYLMEACDDIAYAVLDVEDAVKKGLASFSDLISYLKHHGAADDLIKSVIKPSEDKHNEYRHEDYKLSPAELNDISMQRFRVNAIGAMIPAVVEAFCKNQSECLSGDYPLPLLTASRASLLRDKLQEFAINYAYNHRTVLEVELQGFNVLQGLMDMLWVAIVDREDKKNPASRRKTPFSRYIYGRISENYRRIFESNENYMPLAYREAQLLTDMMSGMTDSFALALYEELNKYCGYFSICEFKLNYKATLQEAA